MSNERECIIQRGEAELEDMVEVLFTGLQTPCVLHFSYQGGTDLREFMADDDTTVYIHYFPPGVLEVRYDRVRGDNVLSNHKRLRLHRAVGPVFCNLTGGFVA